jgi:hypothetical protein
MSWIFACLRDLGELDFMLQLELGEVDFMLRLELDELNFLVGWS